jgi:hypothetical protein
MIRLVFQNPETCTQITQMALQVCVAIGIDYRELLPNSRGSYGDLTDTQRDLKERTADLKRKRRIVLIATKI